VYNKTGHKISTQAEHPGHNSLSVGPFSVKYNKTHKSRLKYEIRHDLCKI